MGESYVQVPVDGVGKKLRTRQRTVGANTIEEQYVIAQPDDHVVSFMGRACTFRTPGRAGTSQKIAALHNATASTVLVNVNRLWVDCLQTVVKAATIKTPMVRLYRFTAVPTNGSSLTKAKLDTALTSNSAVTAWGDASADGTSSGTTLTITPTDMLEQACEGRLLTAVGWEDRVRINFFEGVRDLTLRALEGVVVFLEDAVTSTGMPTTDSFAVTIDWDEYTLP